MPLHVCMYLRVVLVEFSGVVVTDSVVDPCVRFSLGFLPIANLKKAAGRRES